jgi:hypothetical protein
MTEPDSLGMGMANFCRKVLAMPEPEALEYLREWHNRTCGCGMDGGPAGHPESSQQVLDAMRRVYSRPEDPRPSITCPVCGRTSYHPNDVEQGYCGNCHGYTSPVDVLEVGRRFLREARSQQ